VYQGAILASHLSDVDFCCSEYVVLLDNFPWIVLAVYTIIKAEKYMVWSKELKKPTGSSEQFGIIASNTRHTRGSKLNKLHNWGFYSHPLKCSKISSSLGSEAVGSPD
jgi:hypothetical protein